MRTAPVAFPFDVGHSRKGDPTPTMPLCHIRIEALIAFCVSGLEIRDKEKRALT
jgi:hypothetical protein